MRDFYVFLLSLVFLCVVPSVQAAAGSSDLGIAFSSPSGEVDHVAGITVRFTEDMRPLGVMEESAENAPLKLRVKGGSLPAGQFRWVDPSTLAYYFDEPVRGPVEIEALVASGARALNGNVLQEAYAWRINTPPIKIASSISGEAYLPPEGGEIFLYSNHELNFDDLKAKTRLILDGAALPLEFNDYENGAYALRVKAKLPPERELALSVGGGIRPKQGVTPSGPFSFILKSYPFPSVKNWSLEPFDARKSGKGVVKPESPLLIEFSTPVSLSEVLKYLSIRPEAELLREKPDENGEPESRFHSLFYEWKPGVKYELALRPGLKDAYGGVTNKDFSHSFRTGDYAPFLHAPSGTVMEARQGAIYPISLCNIGFMDIRARFFPRGQLPALLGGNREALFSFAAPLPPGAEEKKLRLDFATRRNEHITHRQSMENLFGDTRGGVVLLELSYPSPFAGRGKGEREIQLRSLNVSDLALSVKTGSKSGLAMVTGLQDGKPVAGAELALFGEKSGELWRGVTDGKGLSVLPGLGSLPETGSLYLLARKDDDQVFALADSGRRRELENIPRAAHMLSQLPLYQPGETVRSVIYAREFAEMKTAEGEPDRHGWRALPLGEKLRLEIRNRRGKLEHSEDVTVSEYGSCASSFALPPEAELGGYNFSLRPLNGDSWSMHGHAFTVASFRPPDFKVELTLPPSGPVTAGETRPGGLAAELSGAYFSGASLSGAEAVLTLWSSPSAFTPESLAGYHTGDVAEGRFPAVFHRPPAPEHLGELRNKLDDRSGALFHLPKVEVKPGRPLAISLEASVTDTSGLASQAAGSFLLHPSENYIGLRLPYGQAPGKQIALELKGASYDDKPLTGVAVSLKAERFNAKLNDYEENPVWEQGHVLQNPSGDTVPFTLEKSGVYRISAEVADSAGRSNLTRAVIFIPGPDLEWGGVRGEKFVELIADKDEYVPGETANIVVKNPNAGEHDVFLALTSFERNGVYESGLTELRGPAALLSLPVTEKMAPYGYFSVILIKQETRSAMEKPGPNTPEPENGVNPEVFMASTLIRQKGENAGKVVELATDKDRYLPGEAVKADVRVHDGQGKGEKAEITLLAVDARILRAAGERAGYDPSVSFRPLWLHDVVSSDTRQNLLRRDDVRRLRRNGTGATFKSYPMATSASVEMNAERKSGAEAVLRENFSPDVFWLAQAETDDKGRLNTSFTLPDSLTAYRVVGIAADKAAGFALAEKEIVASKPLQLLPAFPRFLTEGDRLEAGILVQNLDEEAGEVTVELSLPEKSGLRLEGETARVIKLKAGESGLARFPLVAERPGEWSVQVSGILRFNSVKRPHGEKDRALFPLSVQGALPLTTVAAAGMLDLGGKYELPVNPPLPLDGRSRLDVVFAPSPAAGLPLAAQSVIDYPWHCLEQRVSRAMVRSLRLKHGALLGLAPDPEDRARVAETLASVALFQKEDGGFALWQELDRSDFYLTSYVLWAGERIRDFGLDLPGLPEDSAKRAYAYLRDNLDKIPAGLDGDSRAFGLYLLASRPDHAEFARAGIAALCAEITGEKKKAGPFAVAALMLAGRELERKGIKTGSGIFTEDGLLEILGKSAVVTPTQLHFAARAGAGFSASMGSNLRDNGFVLQALNVCKPDYPKLEGLAFWLSQGLGEKDILSTQEAVYGVFGLAAWLETLGGDRPVEMRAAWNGGPGMNKNFNRLVDPPQIWTLPSEELRRGGQKAAGAKILELEAVQGKPYWTARLVYASPSLEARAENAGLSLSRAFSGSGSYRMGEVVEVSLTLNVPAGSGHVLLHDPFPAGLEPLHATRADMAEIDAKQSAYPWQRREMRDKGLLLYAENLQPGVYVYKYKLRAAAPGIFCAPGARAEQMYAPEVFGRSAPNTIKVEE